MNLVCAHLSIIENSTFIKIEEMVYFYLFIGKSLQFEIKNIMQHN